jgi:hypothetical protein
MGEAQPIVVDYVKRLHKARAGCVRFAHRRRQRDLARDKLYEVTITIAVATREPARSVLCADRHAVLGGSQHHEGGEPAKSEP